MRQTMGQKIDKLERDLREANGQIAKILAENSNLKSGSTQVQLTNDRRRLIRFARECEQWGAVPCQCQYAATAALRDIGEEK